MTILYTDMRWRRANGVNIHFDLVMWQRRS